MSMFTTSSNSTIGQGSRCLVVDDFEAMRKVTTNQLRQMGVERIESARNGAEALRLLKSQHFDVVLSDWNMPVMTGVELLQAMRADEKLFSIPFVLITAEAERKRVEEAIAMGVTSMLLKPYSPKQLAQRLEKALQWKPRGPGNFAVDGLPAQDGLAPTAQGPASAPPADQHEAPRPTILIVDDTPDNLLLLSQLFKGEYRVRLAQTGAKAMEVLISNDPPDLVLLDVMMPGGMDGLEVCKTLRADPAFANTLIVMLTAAASEQDKAEALGLGANFFLAKPFSPAKLLELLGILLRNRKT